MRSNGGVTKGLVDNLVKQICAECDQEFESISRYREHLVKPRSPNSRCRIPVKYLREVVPTKPLPF
jgi:hypothetical protein